MKKSEYEQPRATLTPLACPFCGCRPRVLPTNPEVEGNAWGMVACVAKRCPVNPRCRDGSNLSDMRGSGAYKDLAISRWNRRAP